jgi:beta-lactamase superfamily II metal-dependent hydrolase
LIDSSQSDSIDGETIQNATSVQLAVSLNADLVLLTGDASYEAINVHLKSYKAIQLPHHGKSETAEKIFDATNRSSSILYFVSDNTGTSNGGSDSLDTKGIRCKNTKHDGDIDISSDILRGPAVKTTLGWTIDEILSITKFR